MNYRRREDRAIFVLAAVLCIVGAIAFTLLVSQAGAAETLVKPCGKGQNPTPCPTSTLVPTPTPTPTASPGWRLVFDDQFNTPIPRGHFMDGSPDGFHTADGKYTVYKWGWTDTSGNGSYSPGIIEVANGLLDVYIHTPADGKHHVAAFTPQPTGGTTKGGLLSGRYEVRIRADRMIGYKGVPMFWADAATTNDLLLQYGEIDFPEANFDKPISAFMHRTNATSFSDQAFFGTTASWQDWHTYAVEWIAGTSVEFFLDGASIGKTTDRIPTTAMHHNEQFETWTNGTIPDASVAGHVQLDWIRMWAR